MEQLAGDAIRQLFLSSHQIDPTAENEIWAKRRDIYGSEEGVRLDPRNIPFDGKGGHLPQTLHGRRTQHLPPGGIERRLVHRAETLWRRLSGGGIPPAGAVSQFLSGSLAQNSMLLSMSGFVNAGLLFVGDAVSELVRLRPGPVIGSASPHAPLAERIVSLAVKAATRATPSLLDSDYDSIGPANSRQLLLRAIALPFAPEISEGGQPYVVVVASWRRMLSARESAALQKELAHAMNWINGGPKSG